MKLITRQVLASEAAKRWTEQYQGDREGKAAAILALGDSPDPDTVDAVMGNDTWTRVPECDECGAEESAIIQIGEEFDYEIPAVSVCGKCLRKALACIGMTVAVSRDRTYNPVGQSPPDRLHVVAHPREGKSR